MHPKIPESGCYQHYGIFWDAFYFEQVKTFQFIPVLCAMGLIPMLDVIQSRLESNRPVFEEATPLYLPSAEKIKLATLGFDAFAADIFWFDTMNYFGKEFQERGSYKWFEHRCELTTSLHPTDIERFEFCGTLLSWVAKDVGASNHILSIGIENNPTNWRLLYLRSFNKWYFSQDLKGGAEDLKAAAAQPDAPPGLASLAGKLIRAGSNPQMAVEYLEEALSRTTHPAAKAALSVRLRQALLTRDLERLKSLASEYHEQFGRYPEDLDELVEHQMLEEVPAEPFGGEYAIDPGTGNVFSTSGRRGIESVIKTPQMELLKTQ